MKLTDHIKSNRLYLDGAMGSELIARGYDTNLAEQLCVTDPGVVESIHTAYLEAGAGMIYTNTFGANAEKLKGASYGVSEVVPRAVEVARRAADRFGAFVAYDAGPTGKLLAPYGDMHVEQCYELYAQQARLVAGSGSDCVVIETVTDTLELKQAILAFREHTHLPILASMSFLSSGRTFTGCAVSAFVRIAEGLGASAVGINCSLGAAGMLPLVKELKAWARVPIFLKPNAGLPVYRNGAACYDTDAATFAEQMTRIAACGVSILGGCCGTTPEYIRLTVQRTQSLPFSHPASDCGAVCSGSKTVAFTRPLVIGERVNPTGKPLLKKAILAKDYDYVASLAVEQTEDGADILDVNAGLGGIDEAETLSAMVRCVQVASALPVQVDTVKIEAAERALRVVDGVPILNSVNAERDSLNAMLPLARKYGAYLVALCLDENGIPADAAGRVKLAARIADEAARYGIGAERIIVDPLTMAVSVNAENARVTLEALRRIKSELKLKTVLGLSNVSFGLPRREIVNAAFYRMALDAGLDFAIVNPKLRPASDPYADAVLEGKDPGCAAYLARYGETDRQAEAGKAASVRDCIVKGKKAEAGAAVAAAMAASGAAVIETEIIPALNELGALYEAGKAFLPQLMGGAECAKVMLERIGEAYPERSGGDGPVMVLATVKGDVHDIGKNIVKSVLSNYGYRIVDLGKDVPAEAVVRAVREHKARFVGLSALMTTTLPNLAQCVARVKESFPEAVVAVGGAVVTEEFARAAGADVYCRDAQDAVRKLAAYR